MESINSFNKNRQEELTKIIKVRFPEFGREYDLKIEQSSTFEYPENIKKESGILGYERMLVSDASLIDLYRKIYSDAGIEIPESVNTKEQLQKFKRQKEVEDKIEKIERESKFRVSDDIIGYNLLMALSENEYPRSCFMHTMGYYASEKHQQKYLEKFVTDRFFLQKIYDLNAISELNKNRISNKTSDGTEHGVFQHVPEGFDENKTKFEIFDKKTNKLMRSINPNEIPKYKDKIDSGKIYLATTQRGLNVIDQPSANSTFGYRKYAAYNVFDKRPKFGFASDEYFILYLKEIVQRFREINKANTKEIKKPFIDDSFNKVYKMLNYNEELKGFLETGVMKGTYDATYFGGVEYGNKDRDSISDYYQELFHKFGGRFDESVSPDEVLHVGGIYNQDETDIPILIGDETIPQLRWGNAKYANYSNEKGFNFFKIKHAEHLPEKVEK
jgi:hypothetical protein